ncbi:hypothetical protein [Paracoccus sp. ME4]|uniref:hypothetical protein n=1 Tax=Paracoccus sp. ME4 TaxID=3138066 RepID=UPI00398B8082
MTDEDVVLQDDALAQEGMRRYLAARPDGAAFLNLDERTDHGLLADAASIEVDQIGAGYADIRGQSAVNDGHAGSPCRLWGRDWTLGLIRVHRQGRGAIAPLVVSPTRGCFGCAPALTEIATPAPQHHLLYKTCPFGQVGVVPGAVREGRDIPGMSKVRPQEIEYAIYFPVSQQDYLVATIWRIDRVILERPQTVAALI